MTFRRYSISHYTRDSVLISCGQNMLIYEMIIKHRENMKDLIILVIILYLIYIFNNISFHEKKNIACMN